MDIDLGPGGSITAKDVAAVYDSYRHWKMIKRGTLEAKAAHRSELKQEISKHLGVEDEHPWPEVIVRDLARMDDYPGIDDSLWGISPWFEVEKKGLYHRGFEVTLRLAEVTLSRTAARETEPGEGNELVLIVGRIPFESIVTIDWAGDEHYSEPHIYCWFEHKEGCYESVEVYRKAYRDIDPNYWEHLDGVRFKPLRRSRWERWRMHRKIKKAQREFEREYG